MLAPLSRRGQPTSAQHQSAVCQFCTGRADIHKREPPVTEAHASRGVRGGSAEARYRRRDMECADRGGNVGRAAVAVAVNHSRHRDFLERRPPPDEHSALVQIGFGRNADQGVVFGPGEVLDSHF